MPLSKALAGLALTDARRRLGELGLSPFDIWGIVSVGRMSETIAILVITICSEGITRRQQRMIVHLDHPWPERLSGFVIEWLGPVVFSHVAGLQDAPRMVLGDDVVLEGWERRVYDPKSNVRVEIRWHPDRGDDELLTRWTPESSLRERRRVERAVSLLIATRTIGGGRTGRPPGRTDWPPHRFAVALDAFCRRFAEERRRLPTVEQAAEALDSTPLQTFRDRFDRYIRHESGQDWDTFTRTYSAYIRLE